jgi:hypothetical protein
MIGVIYAPKSDQPTSTQQPVETKEPENVERTPSTPSGERKMNVVRGGQSMFARKEPPKPAATQDGGWGTWVWNQVVGHEKKTTAGTTVVVPGGTVAGGGGQSNVVVKALKGLSETVFGF